MDLENTPNPSSADITAAKTSAARALGRRILVTLGIALVVTLIMTWWENRLEANETDPLA